MKRSLLALALASAALATTVRRVELEHDDLAHIQFGEDAAQFNLVMVDGQSTGGVCLDGTNPGFYFQPGSGADAYNWMIYFQGGGWCYDPTDCWGRSKGTLGSSKNWPATGSMGGMLSNNCATNPNFCNWNKVWLAYCDGNSFSGNATAPQVVNGDPLYYRGHAVYTTLMAAVQANVMKAPVPWTSAYDIVLTGCSAGGLATYLHADDFASNYVNPARKNTPPPGVTRPPRFGVLPISGFFLDAPSVAGGVHVYGNEMSVVWGMQNPAIGVNGACVAGTSPADAWQCNMAPYTWPFITSPIFPLNSFYDSWQSGCILSAEPVIAPNSTANGNCSAAPGWNACAGNPEKCTDAQVDSYNAFRAQFIANMNTSVTAGKAGNGAFVSSCHTHCEAQSDNGWTGFKVGGVSMADAVWAWYTAQDNGPAPAAEHTYYDCEYDATGTPRNCNPTC